MPGKKARDSWVSCEGKMAARSRLTLAGQEEEGQARGEVQLGIVF